MVGRTAIEGRVARFYPGSPPAFDSMQKFLFDRFQNRLTRSELLFDPVKRTRPMTEMSASTVSAIDCSRFSLESLRRLGSYEQAL